MIFGMGDLLGMKTIPRILGNRTGVDYTLILVLDYARFVAKGLRTQKIQFFKLFSGNSDSSKA